VLTVSASACVLMMWLVSLHRQLAALLRRLVYGPF